MTKSFRKWTDAVGLSALLLQDNIVQLYEIPKSSTLKQKYSDDGNTIVVVVFIFDPIVESTSFWIIRLLMSDFHISRSESVFSPHLTKLYS